MTAPGYDPILEGPGENDYTRYMQTDALLALQRRREDVLHRDEFLFQAVHQTTELWLKLARIELDDACGAVGRDEFDHAEALVRRAAHAVSLLTGQLEILCWITPQDFSKMRPALGHGSGLESPGWQDVREGSKTLGIAMDEALQRHDLLIGDIYESQAPRDVFRLLEAMVEWDDRVCLWRARHYKIATRIIGNGSVGTKGMLVDKLADLLDRRFFPKLWDVRFQITAGAAENAAKQAQFA